MKHKREKREIRKILLFCLPGIGDTLLFTPTLPLIRNKFPNAHITALTMFQGSKTILETNPCIDRVICYEFLNKPMIESIKFLLKLRKEKFDISLMAFPAYRREYNIISFVVRATRRLTHRFSKGYFSQLTFLNTDTVLVNVEKHNIENNLHLLSLLGVNRQNNQVDLNLCLEPQDRKKAHVFLQNCGIRKGDIIIGIHPGTINYRNAWMRRWSPEKFRELARHLVGKYGAKVLIFEGPSEPDLGEQIARGLEDKVIVAKNIHILQAAALIERCYLFISNDSGLMHVAEALKIPLIVILGPTNPKWISPWRTKYRIVRQNIPCSPCYTYTLPYLDCRRRDFACIQNISVNEVFGRVEELTKKKDLLRTKKVLPFNI